LHSRKGIEVDTAHQHPLILVVDDEWLNRELMEGLLTTVGYRVIQANNGERAIQVVGAHQPDLVLLDVRIPGHSGYEICRQIKQISGIPVVMVTGMEGDEERRMALMAGADDFLSRLMLPEQFLKRIAFWLSRESGGAPT
jgi:putative two-component system response regulator